MVGSGSRPAPRQPPSTVRKPSNGSSRRRPRWQTFRVPAPTTAATTRAIVPSPALCRAASPRRQIPGGRTTGGRHPRTRLTHSLEVGQIGRGIAIGLGCEPDLVELAGLARHRASAVRTQRRTRTEHVRRRPRRIRGQRAEPADPSRLEPKIVYRRRFQRRPQPHLASLDATLKYPWTRRPPKVKFGAYDDDKHILDWIRRDAPGDKMP